MSAPLRPGYKQTEVGCIPEDWVVRSLESTTPQNVKYGIVDGPFGSNLKTIHYRNSGIPIVTSGYVTDGKFKADRYLYVDKAKFQAEKRSAVRPGDIVMAKIGERCGASAILPMSHEIGILSGNALKITIDQQKYSTVFVWQVLWNLHSSGKLESLRTVGAQPALSMANLKIFPIAFPPTKAEQEAIAEALSDADTLIESLEQLLAKKRHLKQGTMQELLTGKKRLPGFSGKWELKAIASFSAFVTKGATPTTYGFNWTDDGVRFLRSECVSSNGLDLAQSMFISETAHKVLSRGEVCEGDILITITGNVGRVVRLPANFGIANINQHIARIRINVPNVSSDFVFHYLSQASIRANYALITTGQAYPQISLKQVRETLVPLPSFAEQTAIASALSDMDAEIGELETQLAKTRTLKQGMMHKLLTGEIRLMTERPVRTKENS